MIHLKKAFKTVFQQNCLNNRIKSEWNTERFVQGVVDSQVGAILVKILGDAWLECGEDTLNPNALNGLSSDMQLVSER